MKPTRLLIFFSLISVLVSCNKGNTPIPDSSGDASILSLSKKEYLRYEDVVVKARGDSKAWVGIYRDIDVVGEVESIYWYYVSDATHTSGESYAIQHYGNFNSSRSTLKGLPPTTYKIVYFSKDYEVADQITFKIKASKLPKPQAPTEATYSLNGLTSGLASGTLSVTFAEDSYATDLVMYWANEDGVLSDYEALSKEKVKAGSTTEISIPERMFIPSESTKLYLYGSNNVGLSGTPYIINLPSNVGYKANGNITAKYSIVSDVHIATENSHLPSSDAKTLHDEHFSAMLDDAIESKDDAIIINGDIANSGSENEWKHTMELLESKEDLPEIHYSIGNHDLYGGTYDTESTLFKKYTGLDSVYYALDIGGYHHVFLGSESSSYSSVDAWLSETQLNWFEQKLEEYASDEPVFVYLHQSLYNTVAGSFKNQGWNGITQDGQVREILSKHKNVIFFNGHSHWDLNSKGNMHAKDDSLGNIFNTASVAYLWSDYYFVTGEYKKGSQGYRLEIYDDNKIMVKGRNYETGKWIPSACYLIEY